LLTAGGIGREGGNRSASGTVELGGARPAADLFDVAVQERGATLDM